MEAYYAYKRFNEKYPTVLNSNHVTRSSFVMKNLQTTRVIADI